MILLAAGGVALFALRRIGKYALTALLGAVMLLDLVSRGPAVPLARRLHFGAPPAESTATAADKAILADKDPGFRVLNLTVSPFQRRHDQLFPPFGRRLPRRQAGPLSGPDRPLPELPQRRSGARHAQHPLPDRPGRRRTARRRVLPRDGKRSGVVRRWDRRQPTPRSRKSTSWAASI